ncbi:MAG TPA: hypothetical protein VFS23_01630 [Vicinamibacterales bacterium]|nr:hypothetical protein [Vicinamibacterales bacterium]
MIDTDSISEKDFELRVGIGLNASAGKFLKDKLRDRGNVKADLVDQMRRFSKISGSFQTLTDDEIWMVNFYRLVGTMDVSWVAQGIDR